MTAKNSLPWLCLATFIGVSRLLAPPTVAAQKKDKKGLIGGIVTYENGRPVRGATVYAVPLGRAIGAIIPHADSDETGHYAIRISRSWFERFAVVAKKEDEDYPDLSKEFYSDGKFQTVNLSASHPNATVIIRLGPKAGVLLGTVVDAVTKAPLSPCVEFRRLAEPFNFLSGSGLVHPTYKLLVPPDTDILLNMYLDGYKTWYFPGTVEKAKQQPVRLRPGEKRAADIELAPDDAAKSGCPKPL